MSSVPTLLTWIVGAFNHGMVTLLADHALRLNFLLIDHPASIVWNVLLVKLKNCAKFCILSSKPRKIIIFKDSVMMEFLLAVAPQL